LKSLGLALKIPGTSFQIVTALASRQLAKIAAENRYLLFPE